MGGRAWPKTSFTSKGTSTMSGLSGVPSLALKRLTVIRASILGRMAPSMPKPTAEDKAFFESILPDDSRIEIKPMFGNVAAFVNGNMFAGTFGPALIVKLGGDAHAELRAMPGTGDFEPMKGRPMKGYVVLPAAWRKAPAKARAW